MENFSKYDDETLVKKLRNDPKKSEAAFTELYKRYAGQVNAYCLKALGDESAAEDIFQETFIKFHAKVRADGNKTNVPGFLITIARNLCLNHKRNAKPTTPIEDVRLFTPPNQNSEKKELLDLINAALELLDFDYREAFILREYQGMSYKEIAEVCEIGLSNAKSRVFRARNKIKEILSPFLEDIEKN